MNCLAEERLIEILEEPPRPEEETHLSRCAACSRKMHSLRQGLELLSEFRPAASPPEPIPTLRFGDYGNCREIACGAMSRVYLSESPEGAPVAVKVCRDAALLDSFSNEVKMLQRCQAAGVPHILPLLDSRLDHLPAFIVTPYFQGGSLSRALHRRPAPEIAPLPFALALARCLASLAELGIVHGDLKASNILLDDAGLPCLADLGGARRVATPGQSSTLSTQSLGHMSLISMSPEQARGQALSPASDVFSFGIILYQLACGRHPFEGGTSWEMAAKILSEEPPDPRPWLKPELRGRFAALLESCLSKDPAERPSARQIVLDLPQIQRPGTTRGGRPAPPRKSPAAAPARPGFRRPAAAALLVLSLISLAYLGRPDATKAPAPAAAAMASPRPALVAAASPVRSETETRVKVAAPSSLSRRARQAALPSVDKGAFAPSQEESESYENAILSMYMYELASCHYLYQNTDLTKDELKIYAALISRKGKIKNDKNLSDAEKELSLSTLEMDVLTVLGEANYQILNNYRDDYEGHKVLTLLAHEFDGAGSDKKERFVREFTEEIENLRLDRSDERKYFSKELWDNLIARSSSYLSEAEIRALESLEKFILKANKKNMPGVLMGVD
ncbi:MAG: hypothetical protein RL095_2987 [Verrucomicrobiota bacterium]|jgi:serine/threonine protein kinase